MLLCFLLIILTPFMLDSFQVGSNIFIAFFTFLPILVILTLPVEKLKTSTFIVLAALLFTNNIHSFSFYFNRIFFPGTSKAFVKEFLRKASDSTKINAVYFTKFSEIPFWFVDRPGFNIQNNTDSLFSTCVSYNLLTKSDSAKIRSKNLWDKFISIPFNQFVQNEGKGLGYEDQVQLFMKKVNCRVVFINNSALANKPLFLRKIAKDSLYCKQFGYWAYFIKQ